MSIKTMFGKAFALCAVIALASAFGEKSGFGQNPKPSRNASLPIQLVAPEKVEIKNSAWASASVHVRMLDQDGNLIPGAGGGIWDGGLVDAKGLAKLTLKLDQLPKEWKISVDVKPKKDFAFAGNCVQDLNIDQLPDAKKPLTINLISAPDGEPQAKFRLVSGSSGNPIANTKVQLYQKRSAKDSDRIAATVTTNSKGEFALTLSSDLLYYIQGEEKNGGELVPYTPVDVSLISKSQTEPIVITSLCPVATVQLMVRDDKGDQPMKDSPYSVMLSGTTDEKYTAPGYKGTEYKATLKPDKNGLLSIYNDVRPGGYKIELIPGSKLYKDFVVVVNADMRIKKGGSLQNVTAVLRKALNYPLEVAVKNAFDGKEIVGAGVRFFNRDLPQKERTDATGRVQFKEVPERDQMLEVSASGFRSTRKSVKAPTAGVFTISLMPLRTLKFQVGSTDAAQFKGTVVVLQAAEEKGMAGPEMHANFDAAGKAVIGELIDGPAIVLVFDNKAIVHSERITIKGDAQIPLSGFREPAVVSGVIQLPKDARYSEVILLDQTTRAPMGRALMDAKGLFSMRAAPGEYEIFARGAQQYVSLGKTTVSKDGAKEIKATVPEDFAKREINEMAALGLNQSASGN